MLIAQRQSRLQQLIAEHGICDLETLARELGVSQSTIRRDIDGLVQQGLVKRTHGGVIWVGQQNGNPRPDAFDQRVDFRREAKQRIAAAAAKLIQPDQTILLDGGTSTFYLAQQLLGRPLQIVTNSLPIAGLFQNDDNVELILTGGLLYPRYGVLLGPMMEAALASIHPQIMFLSVAGVSDGMLFNQNLLLVEAERRMMQQAQKVVLLVDSSKFGQQALAQLCPLADIDVVVTDAPLPDAPCEVIVAA